MPLLSLTPTTNGGAPSSPRTLRPGWEATKASPAFALAFLSVIPEGNLLFHPAVVFTESKHGQKPGAPGLAFETWDSPETRPMPLLFFHPHHQRGCPILAAHFAARVGLTNLHASFLLSAGSLA